MKCWRLLKAGTPTPGIPYDWFPVENAVADEEGLIHEASVALVVPKGYAKLYRRTDPRITCQFSEAWLRQPNPKSKPKDKILLAVETSIGFPDKAAGDSSVPVISSKGRVLYTCQKEATAIELLTGGAVVFNGDKPAKLPPAKLEALRELSELSRIASSIGRDTALLEDIL